MALTVPAEAKKGFFVVIGIIAAIYVGSLVVGKLP